jgi:hypothetical protein
MRIRPTATRPEVVAFRDIAQTIQDIRLIEGAIANPAGAGR